jgi:hypothetical protein
MAVSSSGCEAPLATLCDEPLGVLAAHEDLERVAELEVGREASAMTA